MDLRSLLISLLLFEAASAVSANAHRTYQHVDEATGRTLTCDRCPAGTHMRAHCTATRRTQCSPCAPHHFTQHWNYLPKCLYCSAFCGENQVVVRECSPLHNRECACKPGYYLRADFCVKHTECPPGFGVSLPGTAERNTQCERCPHRSYSATTSSRDTCTPHTNCTAHGLQLLLRGSKKRNNLCASCEDLQHRGALMILKQILPDFFAHQKKKMTKLAQFVRHLLPVDKEVAHLCHKQLLSHISEWIQDAGQDRLRCLPAMLRASRLHRVACKLERMIMTVEMSGDCINSH
ncbi:tumor necrosis factor receptor superfamily member 6B-like [Arapaima gigas]